MSRLQIYLALFASIALLIGDISGTKAQAASDAPASPLYRQIFSDPSEPNGYADLLEAAEIVRSSKTLAPALELGTSLSDIRQALTDPDAARALILMRQGLAKPMWFPETLTDSKQIVAVFAPLRSLEHLLSAEQYVLLADGRSEQTVAVLQDGLRIGNALQREGLFGSLIGMSLTDRLLEECIIRLDRFSAPACDRLLILVKNWSALPAPRVPLPPSKIEQAAEQRFAMRLGEFTQQFAQRTKHGQALMNSLTDLADQQDNPYLQQVLDMVRDDIGEGWSLSGAMARHPDVFSQDYVDAISSGEHHADVDVVLLNLSASLNPPNVAAQSNPALTNSSLDLPFSTLHNNYEGVMARLTLLGVHAAMRRFKWEYQRLPNDLDDLKSGFEELKSGQFVAELVRTSSLVYKRTDALHYELKLARP
jgi:hypothetical protein